MNSPSLSQESGKEFCPFYYLFHCVWGLTAQAEDWSFLYWVFPAWGKKKKKKKKKNLWKIKECLLGKLAKEHRSWRIVGNLEMFQNHWYPGQPSPAPRNSESLGGPSAKLRPIAKQEVCPNLSHPMRQWGTSVGALLESSETWLSSPPAELISLKGLGQALAECQPLPRCSRVLLPSLAAALDKEYDLIILAKLEKLSNANKETQAKIGDGEGKEREGGTASIHRQTQKHTQRETENVRPPASVSPFCSPGRRGFHPTPHRARRPGLSAPRKGQRPGRDLNLDHPIPAPPPPCDLLSVLLLPRGWRPNCPLSRPKRWQGAVQIRVSGLGKPPLWIQRLKETLKRGA
jgi:hypothetical protein